jgi:hypothetical protein
MAPLFLVGLAGCGGDPDAAVTLVSVKGVITLNGKPMANAVVQFVPDPGNKTGTAGGDTTGPEGNYMARYRGRSGLAPGKYKVSISPGTPSNVSGVPTGASDAFKDDPFMASEASRAAAAAKPAAKNLEVKGEFDAEVSEQGSTLDFDVKASSAAASGSPAKK